MTNEPADELLAGAVIVGRVDDVDAGVQHGVENLLHMSGGHPTAAPTVLTADLLRAVAQESNFQARSSPEPTSHHGRLALGTFLCPRRRRQVRWMDPLDL